MNNVYRIFGLFLLIGILLIGCEKMTSPEKEYSRENRTKDLAGLNKTTGYEWQNHASPFDFLFGNHFDTHQQTKISGNGQLNGFFYIKFNGNFTPEGYPEATHGNCSQTPGTVAWAGCFMAFLFVQHFWISNQAIIRHGVLIRRYATSTGLFSFPLAWSTTTCWWINCWPRIRWFFT